MNNKIISKKREKKLAKDVNGKAHARSGGFWFKKSDASDIYYQYEDKFTHNLYYSINIDILNKIEKEAKQVNKIPVLRFGFIKTQRDYVVMRIQDVFPLLPQDYFKNSPSFVNITGKSKRFDDESLYALYGSNVRMFITLNYEHFDKTYILMYYKDFLELMLHERKLELLISV
jgi:hypothetical protein